MHMGGHFCDDNCKWGRWMHQRRALCDDMWRLVYPAPESKGVRKNRHDNMLVRLGAVGGRLWGGGVYIFKTDCRGPWTGWCLWVILQAV